VPSTSRQTDLQEPTEQSTSSTLQCAAPRRRRDSCSSILSVDSLVEDRRCVRFGGTVAADHHPPRMLSEVPDNRQESRCRPPNHTHVGNSHARTPEHGRLAPDSRHDIDRRRETRSIVESSSPHEHGVDLFRRRRNPRRAVAPRPPRQTLTVRGTKRRQDGARRPRRVESHYPF